jgi:hypothetical protein
MILTPPNMLRNIDVVRCAAEVQRELGLRYVLRGPGASGADSGPIIVSGASTARVAYEFVKAILHPLAIFSVSGVLHA